MKQRVLRWNETIANCRTTVGYKIFDYWFISEEAKKLINPLLVGNAACEPDAFFVKHPLALLNVGQAYYLHENESPNGADTMAWKLNKQTGRKFKSFYREDLKCWEIVRIF